MIALCELGALGVDADGVWSEITGPRMSMVVAALGLAGRSGINSAQLTEMIWPPPDRPATARQSLANIVMRLRSVYGSEFVESTGSSYRLGDHVRSERARFIGWVEQADELVARAPDQALQLLDRALGCWRGEPWAGIERPVEVEADRARLIRLHTEARRLRATALVEQGRETSALDDLQLVLDADPYDEFARYHVAKILADSGQRPEALALIRESHRLFSERGLVPDTALITLEERLLSASSRLLSDREPLPEQHGGFVGRVDELEAIGNELRASRLVTVHGIGGSGKTRLAVHVAAGFDDAVMPGFVGLAEARSPAQVELLFARGLGVSVAQLDGLDPDSRRRAVVDAAAMSAGLLVVDNCEHLIDDVRQLVGEMLARPGRLRVLATSRVPLELPGEQRYPIPAFDEGPDLFRLHAHRLGAVIDPGDGRDVVGEICDAVDHLPLAIEIAAAQTPFRTIREILDELSRGVVHRDSMQAEARHETMSAAIEWSHGLLPTDAADALVRLGVFDTPFERVDAAAVITARAPHDVLDSLVRSSLVEREDRDGLSTYRLPVPVRQYSVDQLDRRGEATEVAIALADGLLEFTDRPYGDVWWRLSVSDEISPRFSHITVAVDALRDVGRIADATRLASRLGGVGYMYGRADEVIEILTPLLAALRDAETGDDEADADALLATVLCADAAQRGELFSRSLGLLARIGGPAGNRHQVAAHCFHALVLLMSALLSDDDYGGAREELERARRTKDALASPINRAHIAQWESAIHLLEGDWEAAEAAARRSLADSAGTWFGLNAGSCLCHARLQLGDADAALDLARSHDRRDRGAMFGDRSGLTVAIALVQRGDVDTGLAEIAAMQQQVHETPWARHYADIAMAVAEIAHLLGHDDLALETLESGAIGFGPWLGYLIPKLRRDLGRPDLVRFGNVTLPPSSRSAYFGRVTSRVVDELVRRCDAADPTAR